MQKSLRAHLQAITLAEILVALGTMALALVVMTQAMLVLNKNSARARVLNLAKAAVLSSIQEVGVVDYDPKATPPVVPTILNVGTTVSTINLGDASTGIGNIPASMTWTVTSVGGNNTRSVKCRVDYTYLGRPQSYEAVTFRAAD